MDVYEYLKPVSANMELSTIKTTNANQTMVFNLISLFIISIK